MNGSILFHRAWWLHVERSLAVWADDRHQRLAFFIDPPEEILQVGGVGSEEILDYVWGHLLQLAQANDHPRESGD